MEKRVEKAINIFLDALNEGTLAAGTCAACAVGNLVAAGIGIKAIIPHKNNEQKYIVCENEHWAVDILKSSDVMFDSTKSLKCIAATDFTIRELIKIERAFERNTNIIYLRYDYYTKEEVRKDQIKGLEAVVKVMLTFNNDTKTNVKEVFTNKAELISL